MARGGEAAGPRGEPAEGRGRVQGSWMSCAAGVWTPLHLPARHRTPGILEKSPKIPWDPPNPPRTRPAPNRPQLTPHGHWNGTNEPTTGPPWWRRFGGFALNSINQPRQATAKTRPLSFFFCHLFGVQCTIKASHTQIKREELTRFKIHS